VSDDGPRPFHHLPVLLDRVVQLFEPVPPGWLVDATVGGGGHSEALLDADPARRLLGLDQDDRAMAAASARLARFGDRVQLRHVRFDHLSEVAHDIAPAGEGEGVSGVLFDLGVSSPQLDDAERGFSFRGDGPVDMRMDRRRARSAADLVNNMAAQQLAATIRRYGDERFANRIAQAIVAARPIETTGQLAHVVANAVPAPARRAGHPARKTFQALRIAVNEELEILADSLDQAIDLLTPGGRCVALAYHSGEDRIVKDRFRLAVTGGCECPPGLPCGCGAQPKARFVKRGAEKASAEEIEANRRSESVRLRVIEAIEPIEPGQVAPEPHSGGRW
jgi:16S rRNA (cytosine1402-N4)-methyltransferase